MIYGWRRFGAILLLLRELFNLPIDHSFQNAATVILRTDNEHGSDRFIVHEKLICDASPTIADAIQTSCTGYPAKFFTLTKTCAPTINTLIHWLYRGNINLSSYGEHTTAAQLYWNYAFLCVCATKYSIRDLQFHLIHELSNIIHERLTNDQQHGYNLAPPPSVISYGYYRTPTWSPFLKILAACYAFHVHPKWLSTEEADDLLTECEAFGVDLARNFALEKADPNSECFIHEQLGVGGCRDIEARLKVVDVEELC